jgi:hypothetical protein
VRAETANVQAPARGAYGAEAVDIGNPGPYLLEAFYRRLRGLSLTLIWRTRDNCFVEGAAHLRVTNLQWGIPDYLALFLAFFLAALTLMALRQS